MVGNRNFFSALNVLLCFFACSLICSHYLRNYQRASREFEMELSNALKRITVNDFDFCNPVLLRSSTGIKFKFYIFLMLYGFVNGRPHSALFYFLKLIKPTIKKVFFN